MTHPAAGQAADYTVWGCVELRLHVIRSGVTGYGAGIRCRSVPAGMRSTLLTFGSQWLTLDQATCDPKNRLKMLIYEHKNRKIYNWIIGSQNNCCFMYFMFFMFFIYPFILFFI